MDVLHHHIGIRHREVIVGEVPEALDAQIHQTAADLFRTVAGHTEHCDLGVMLGTERLQLVDMADLDAAEPSQSRIRSTAPPKGELYEWGRESFCFSGEGQPARKMQKSSPIGGAGKAVRLWLRGFFL